MIEACADLGLCALLLLMVTLVTYLPVLTYIFDT